MTPPPVDGLDEPSMPLLRLEPAPPLRRPVHRSPFLVAAAVLAVVALAGAVLTGVVGDDAGDIGVATSPDGDPAAPTSGSPPTTAPPPSTTGRPSPLTGSAVEPRSADEAVLTWVDALAAGDRQTAVGLLGPGSMEHLASLGQEPDDLLAELGEGFGAWSASADRSTTEVTVQSSGEGSVEVVVLMGTVEQEGTTEHRMVALPVRSLGGRYRVEPFDLSADETRIEFTSPPPGPEGLGSLPPDGVIEFVAPGAAQVSVSLDDGEVHQPPVTPDGRVRYDPPGDMSSQTHLLVVASVGPEHLTAAAVTFLVEG